MTKKKARPIGSTAAEAGRRRAARSPTYRAQQVELAPFREIAWLLIRYRMDKGLSQKELAVAIGTSHSQISRIESGRHKTNIETLRRIAHGLGLKLIVGFEDADTKVRKKRQLVAL